MRKLFNLFAAALVVLAAVSCEKSEALPCDAEGKVVTLSATIDNGGTKTSLGGKEGNEYSVLWSEGDEIALIQGTNVCVFTLSDGIGEKSATFTGTLVEGFNLNEDYTAFYPASAVDENGKISIPDTQIYAEGSFGLGAMPMAAIKSDETLNFKNLFGVLKLTLTGNENETVQSVRVASSNGTIMNGPIELSIAQNSSITANMGGQLYANQMVTLNCNNGVALTQSGVQFLISVPAGQHNFCVTVITKDENNNTKTYYKKTANTNSFTASSIKNMPILPLSDMVVGTVDSYVENGVYLGEGVALPAGEGKTIIWAPVNCGYDAVNFKYGKLYQWGRKDGQGYYYDETLANNDLGGGPSSITTGPINWESYIANADIYSNVFFKGSSGDDGDWLSPQKPDLVLWGNGIKTDHDPCPAGWRVPTSDEMKSLSSRLSTPSAPIPSENIEKFELERGYYFYGVTDNANTVFFPAAGCLLKDGVCETRDYYGVNKKTTRGYIGNYWTSTTDGACSHSLIFGKSYDSDYEVWYYQLYIKEDSPRSYGFSVRCVKDMPQSQPMPGSN